MAFVANKTDQPDKWGSFLIKIQRYFMMENVNGKRLQHATCDRDSNESQ